MSDGEATDRGVGGCRGLSVGAGREVRGRGWGRLGRRAVRSVVVATVWASVVIAAPAPISAQPGPDSWGLDDPSWRGLSNLAARAEAWRVDLEGVQRLDWGEVDTRRPLVFLHPTVPVDASSLASFVSDGGRVLVADDFGRAEEVFARFDVRRRTDRSLPHQTFLKDDSGLPVFFPQGRHALLDGVGTLVANRPAVLEHEGRPIVPYQGGDGLVYDMKLGEGRAVLSADPSLFINLMIGLADNEAFAENALRYVCADRRPCRPLVLAGDFEQVGTYGAAKGRSGRSDEGTIASIDAAIEDVQQRLSASPLLHYLAMILALGLVFYLGAVLSLRQRRSYSAHIDETLGGSRQATSEFEWNLRRFVGEEEENYALPVAILKEHFEEVFLREMGVESLGPGNRPPVEGLVDRFGREYLADCSPRRRRDVQQQLEGLLTSLARAPTRHRVVIEGDAYFGEDELVRMYRRAMTVLEQMDAKEEYERRIRSLV